MNRLRMYTLILSCTITAFVFVSCGDDFLNRAPLSQITPELYFEDEAHLAAYTINQYNFSAHDGKNEFGSFGNDAHTDNFASIDYNASRYCPGQMKVPQTGGSWNFGDIRHLNYYLNTVVPRFEEGKIKGNVENIRHYIGEGYFLRAYAYFEKVVAIGDCPIITECLPDEMQPLVEASKRLPHSEVIRFIISDLDKAIELMKNQAPDGMKNRLSRYVALLYKSRVALYEATWLKYFKGTAFVPNGVGWQGATKDYNKGYQYQAGDIDAEIDWLFEQAMDAASAVADNIKLTPNNGVLQQNVSDSANDYFDMFGAVDMSKYEEVLLWKAYNASLGISHFLSAAMAGHNGMTGVTKGLVESFLMKNGLPIYDNSSGYHGDDYISDIRADRDLRLWLFLKEPGQKNVFFNESLGQCNVPVEICPDIVSGNGKYTTGYTLRKGINYDGLQYNNGKSFIGAIIFRASEAYLNYMEACYEKNGNLDGKAKDYWIKLRKRAGIDTDFSITIAATDLETESKGDWAVYSAGKMVDATLYNIRRERRCELIAESLRWQDMKRWRTLDRLMNHPYHIEGFKLWGPMKNWYNPNTLKYTGPKPTVSSPEVSNYLRPYEITGKEMVKDGYRWHMAHYWEPIAVDHFLISSVNNDISTSPIYQNPGWSVRAGEGPSDFMK